MPTPPMVAVIDSDRVTAYGLALLLRDWGYEFAVGVSARDLHSRTEGQGQRIAAIVADDRSLDGRGQAAALARLAKRTIPTIVLVSADAGTADGLNADAAIPVAKPVDPNALRDLLRSVVTLPA